MAEIPTDNEFSEQEMAQYLAVYDHLCSVAKTLNFVGAPARILASALTRVGVEIAVNGLNEHYELADIQEHVAEAVQTIVAQRVKEIAENPPPAMN